MPDKLDSKLLAPCGINCISCERYQNPCAGCLIGDDGKTKASLKCKIKSCFDTKNFSYCGRCSEFPCPQMKKHSKKYIKRYFDAIFFGRFAIRLQFSAEINIVGSHKTSAFRLHNCSIISAPFSSRTDRN